MDASHPQTALLAQCPACGLAELDALQLCLLEDGRLLSAEDLAAEKEDPKAQPAAVEREIEIDVCPCCRGAWFDGGELAAITGEADIEKDFESAGRLSDRACPRGHGFMPQVKLKGRVRTPMELCPRCHGLWLDGHERHKVAKLTTAEGRQALGEKVATRGAIWAVQLLTQLPVEVENKRSATPWVVYSLLAILVLLYGVQELTGLISLDHCTARARAAGHGECLAAIPGQLRAEWSDASATDALKGRWWTLVSSIFLHGGLAHMLGNLYFLYIFGDNVEDVFGRRRFIILFLVCGLVGALAQVLFTDATATAVVGASGAIAGVMAAYLLCFPRNRMYQMIGVVQVVLPAWTYLIVWIGLQFGMGVFGSGSGGVAWFAHIGGFVAGLVMGVVYRRAAKAEVARAVRAKARRKG